MYIDCVSIIQILNIICIIGIIPTFVFIIMGAINFYHIAMNNSEPNEIKASLIALVVSTSISLLCPIMLLTLPHIEAKSTQIGSFFEAETYEAKYYAKVKQLGKRKKVSL